MLVIQENLDGLTNLGKAGNAGAFLAFLTKIFIKDCVVISKDRFERRTGNYNVIP